MNVLINLIGPITLHPYVDRTSLSFLTRDTRGPGLVTQIYDGVIYEAADNTWRAPTACGATQQIAEGFIRTSFPLLHARGRRLQCGNVWHHKDEADKRNRITKVQLEQDLLLITPGDESAQIVVDLGVEMEFDAHDRTLWDFLTEQPGDEPG